MNKFSLLLTLFFLFALCPMLFASVEKSFSDMGYADFVVDGKNQQQCTEYKFLDERTADESAILYLKMKFFPLATGAESFEVSLNDSMLVKSNLFKDLSFCDGDSCKVKLPLNKEDILPENILKICLSTSSSVTKATVLSDSTIGFYETAIINSTTFVKTISKGSLIFGEILPVTLKLKNEGSKEAFVDVNYMRNLVESEPKSYEIIGDSYFSGVIGPGEEKTFEYMIKPLRTGVITIIPSSVEYLDVFGDKIVWLSNVVEIMVNELDDKLIGEIMLDKSKAKLGETVKATIALKNISNSTVSNIDLKVFENGKEIGSFTFGNIASNQTKYEEIAIKSDLMSTSELTCKYTYAEGEESACNIVSVAFEREELSWAMIQSFILLLVGVVIFGGLYFYITGSGKPKEAKKKEETKK